MFRRVLPCTISRLYTNGPQAARRACFHLCSMRITARMIVYWLAFEVMSRSFMG